MRIVIIFCLIGFLTSCRGPKTELLPPHLSADSVLTRDEMINVLVDVHLVEASLVFQRNHKGNIPQLTQNYYQWLYKKYHMSPQRLRGNLDYYKMDPKNFSKMYQDVVRTLTDRAKKPELQQKKNTHMH
jgi:hypothetical protein